MKKLTSLFIILGIVTTASIAHADPPEIVILGVTYTQGEYASLKANHISRVAQRNNTPLSHKEVATWIAIFNRENAQCRFRVRNINGDNLIDRINVALQAGC